jgi:mannosyltransferase OCH1-like enzyme
VDGAPKLALVWQGTMPIPKFIHQLWIDPFGASLPLPKDSAQNLQQWRASHPDFDHRLWCLDELEHVLPEYFGATFRRVIPPVRFPAMQADIARLFILAAFGGIWIDLKVIPRTRFLDQLLHYRLVLIEHFPAPKGADPTGILTNSFIASEPWHEFLLRCLQIVVAKVDRRCNEDVWMMTGPGALMAARSELRTSDTLYDARVLGHQLVWNDLLALGTGSYNYYGRHWSRRQKAEPLYLY